MADVNTATNNSIIDNIRLLYGSAVASELISVEQEFDDLEFKMKAYISNANYHVKKLTMLLFINRKDDQIINGKQLTEDSYNFLVRHQIAQWRAAC
jgi:DNA mismatch repair protein MLH1